MSKTEELIDKMREVNLDQLQDALHSVLGEEQDIHYLFASLEGCAVNMKGDELISVMAYLCKKYLEIPSKVFIPTIGELIMNKQLEKEVGRDNE